jgi:NitT/TauT family transport system ATP-binding protein
VVHFAAAIYNWGRYAELFEYDEETQQFGLEEEEKG